MQFAPVEGGLLRVRKMVKKFEGDWPDKISGLLVQQSDSGTQAYEVNLPIHDANAALTSASTTPAGPSFPALPAQSPGLMLLYAFLGGMILNVMPCVLPVIALK